MNKQLLDYIKKEKRNARTKDAITDSLLLAGWKSSDIKAAFGFLDKSLNETSQSPISDNGEHTKKTTPGRSFFLRHKRVVLTVVLFLAVGGAGLYGYEVFTKGSVLHPNEMPKETGSALNSATPIIAYIESTSDDFAGSVVFYDTQKRKALPPDPVISADNNSLFQLGPWSPDGYYLPVLALSNPGDDNEMVNLYLFDAQKRVARRIYHSQWGDDNSVWSGSSFGFLSAWMDNTRFVVQSDRDTNSSTTTLTYFTLDGDKKTTQQPDVFKQASSQLSYTVTLAVDTKIETVTVGGKVLSFVPEGILIGVVDNSLVVLKKPQAVSIVFDDGGDSNSNKELADFQKQFEEYQRQGMSEEERSKKVQEFLEPKGETVLNFYNLETGAIEYTVNLTDGTWQTLSVLVNTSGEFLVAHQTDSELLPTKERFITIYPFMDPQVKVVVREDIVAGNNKNFSNKLLTQNSSFSLSYDGNWIISERGSIVDDPVNSAIIMRNIVTDEEVPVCSKYCSGVRVFYPLSVQNRY